MRLDGLTAVGGRPPQASLASRAAAWLRGLAHRTRRAAGLLAPISRVGPDPGEAERLLERALANYEAARPR